MNRLAVRSVPLTALQRAQHRWQCLASVVAGKAYQRHKTTSAWLHDHAHRPSRPKKGAGQLVRMLEEMEQAGMSPDEQDRELLDFVRGVRRDIHASATPPAA